MAAFDLPATIKHIISKTYSNNKLIFIGHSQGTSSILAGMCENLEFFQKTIKCVVLLAPAAKLEYCETIVFQMLSMIDFESMFSKGEMWEINKQPSETISNVRNYI